MAMVQSRDGSTLCMICVHINQHRLSDERGHIGVHRRVSWLIRQSRVPKKFDDNGRPLLLGQPVYLSPNFADIGASAKPLAFGDLSRYQMRQVGNSFTLLRYDEMLMANMQLGWQAWLRADGQLTAAGSTDYPIVTMAMHS
jgi:hypothetical protein